MYYAGMCQSAAKDQNKDIAFPPSNLGKWMKYVMLKITAN
jgi:hypothetical protein